MLFLAFLIPALMLESSVTTLPLTFITLVVFTVLWRDEKILLAGFVAGLLLDIMTISTLGISSLFFTIFLSLVLLYEKKLEITSIYYLVLFSFMGSLIYSYLKHFDSPLFLSLAAALIAVLIFKTAVFINSNNRWHKE